MQQDEWFLISVPLVIFLVVMIAASLTLPQPWYTRSAPPAAL